MATRKKAKGKAKTKRKKSPKPKTVQKKPPKKAQVRRASPKKERPTAKAGAKTELARRSAQPAHPALLEERIGVVTHYYGHLSVAILRLESGTLRVGDMIHIRGHTPAFSQRVEALQ